jgi:hypothetical protein
MRPAVTKERGPQKAWNVVSTAVYMEEVLVTYSSDSLHTEDKGILSKVPGVAQTVLLPQLAKQIVHASHGPEVDGKVSLEEGVDASAEHEPHDGGQVAVAETWSYPLDEHICNTEDGSASSSKHADQLKRVPLVGEVACNLGLDGVVRVVLPREEREVAGSHCVGGGVRTGDREMDEGWGEESKCVATDTGRQWLDVVKVGGDWQRVFPGGKS